MDPSTKPKAPETTKSPYQYYEDRRVRPSSASETKTHTPKGTLYIYVKAILLCYQLS